MAGNSEDADYWEMSRVKAFSFDDENEIKRSTMDTSQPFEQLAMRVRADIPDSLDLKDTYYPVTTSVDIPLHNLLSEDALNNILQVQAGEIPQRDPISPTEEVRILKNRFQEMYESPSPSTVLDNVLFGRPFIMENCRSLKCKTDMLDSAIKFGDGDSIVMITLWLQKTLNRRIFQDIIKTRPVAVQHYASHLKDRNQSNALTDLLVMLGKPNETVLTQFQLIVSQPIETRLRKLNILYTSHCTQPGTDTFIVNSISKYISLLEWQLTNPIQCPVPCLGLSVLQILYWLCMNHWDSLDTAGKFDAKVFAKAQNIAPMQYDWTVILTRGIKQDWNSIRTLYIKTGFLKKRQVSTQIPLDKLILQLHKLQAPADFLEELLNFLSEPKRTTVTRAISAI